MSGPIPAAAELARAIDEAGVVELAAELVRIPSHPGVPRQEEAVAFALARWLERHGLTPELVEVVSGRPNLLCALRGATPGRRLVLCGHTDTVPLNAGSAVDLGGEVRDGWLRGRGAVDMKGAVAAMAAALVALARTGALPAGELLLAAVVDEEMESIGAEHLLRSGAVEGADGAVVGEPTSNRVCRGHKGLEWLEIELTGRAAHGGTPQAGVNAIVAAARLVTLIAERLAPRLAARAHPLLGPPTLNLGTIRGGDQPSTVAASCVLALDRRSVPGETWAAITGELEELLAQVASEMPGLGTALRRVPGGMATMEHAALVTAADHPLVRAAEEAVDLVGAGARVGSGEVPPARPGPSLSLGMTTAVGVGMAFPAWTDGALLASVGAIPTIVLGPGDLSLAHSPREAVPVGELVDAALIYAATAVRFCAGREGRESG